MQHLVRLAGCAALAGLLITGGCALRPSLFADLGLDWWTWPKSLWQHDVEHARDAELTRRWQGAEWRTRSKDRICGELTNHLLPAGRQKRLDVVVGKVV